MKVRGGWFFTVLLFFPTENGLKLAEGGLGETVAALHAGISGRRWSIFGLDGKSREGQGGKMREWKMR